MSGEWVLTSEGRYVWDQKDGWYFDHLDQAWYQDHAPASIPTGAPAAATRRRLWSRLTEMPEGIFMAGWNAAFVGRGWFLGTIVMVLTWIARVAVVYSGYQIAKAWTVGSDGGWFLTHYVLGEGEPGTDPTEFAMVYTFCYVFLAFFALIILTICTLNDEQSAALTTAFVAHNMYRHYVKDMAQVQENAARQERYHPPGKLTL